MGTTSSPQVFVARINKCATAIGDAPRVGARAAALAVKTAVLAEDAKIAPNLFLSGVGKKGAKIGVRYVDGINAFGHAAVLVYATGPAHLIERDTKAHDIGLRSVTRKTARGRAAGTAKALGSKAKGFGPFAHVHVSGTKGRHPFERGVEVARPLTGAALKVATHQALAKAVGI